VDVWTSQSNPGKQAALSVLCSVAGVVLAIAFRDFRDSGTKFSPGRFFEGASDRSTVEGWKRRLEEYLGQ
jgi:hypothetical protein